MSSEKSTEYTKNYKIKSEKLLTVNGKAKHCIDVIDIHITVNVSIKAFFFIAQSTCTCTIRIVIIMISIKCILE